MRYIADFHLHSKYSRATSRQMDLEHLDQWAKIKGIQILGTSDFTHPIWFKELKEKLEQIGEGIYQLKSQIHPVIRQGAPSDDGANPKSQINSKHQILNTKFILTTEISCIYSKGGKVRRIHLVVFAPNLETVEKINQKLGEKYNLKSDGRPILGLDAKELVKILLDISQDIFIVPAHAWTPWYSIFGSKSGFNSIEECFEEMTPNIFALETGLSCYDKNTEVLTENGWKIFNKIDYSNKICTLNLESNEVQFQHPQKIFKYNYRGKMYRLKTRRADLLVTPNHKLLISKCDFRKPPQFFLKEAEFLFNKSKRFKKNGLWNGQNIKCFSLPAVKIKHGSRYYSGLRNKSEKKIPIEPWLKFFGFWIAEGWVSEGKNGHYAICLSNQNRGLLLEMKKILESFGYNVNDLGNVIRVRDYQLFYYLKQFGKSGDKFIPSEVKSLSKKLLEVFFEYYIKGDGHRYGRGGKGLSATTISEFLRDDLQEIALKIGISAYYKLHNKKGTPIKSLPVAKAKGYKQSKNSWVIYFIRKNIYTVLPSTIKKYNYIESWVDYNDFVYCLEVPNHVIYIRRNGVPLWCGNSDPLMNWRWSYLDKYTLISNSDAHSPENIGREANVFDFVEEPDYFQIIEAIKTRQKFLYTIEFFPEEGKYHFDGHRFCGIRLEPSQTRKEKGLCPKCKRPLTVGVMYRVQELADREEPSKPKGSPDYKSLIPLKEILAEIFKTGKKSKRVDQEYQELIKKAGNEFNILLNFSETDLIRIGSPELVEAILKMRGGEVIKEPGYDGVYGKIKIFEKPILDFKNHKKGSDQQQSSLF